MTLLAQAQRLVDLGVPRLAGISGGDLVAHAQALDAEPGGVIAVHPNLVAASTLAGLLMRDGKAGFVVVDMTDLDAFSPIPGVEIPEAPVYLVHQVGRGDEMRNWSPDEALPAITAAQRSPLTVSEGISWLLQRPELLEPNHCFMTVGSRLRQGGRLDARTPAIWISGGTGRDGAARRNAPKVGWCWAGNRHTWLGFASTSHRSGPTTARASGGQPA